MIASTKGRLLDLMRFGRKEKPYQFARWTRSVLKEVRGTALECIILFELLMAQGFWLLSNLNKM